MNAFLAVRHPIVLLTIEMAASHEKQKQEPKVTESGESSVGSGKSLVGSAVCKAQINKL